MSWTTLRHSIDASIEDYTGEIAYRSAARIIPQCSKGYSPSRRAKEAESPLVLAIMRGLMAARVCLDGFDAETKDATDRARNALARYTQFTSHVAHSIRFALKLVSPGARAAKIEDMRICIQSAYDLNENNYKKGADGVRRDPSSVSLWDSALSDFDNLIRKRNLLPPLPPSYVETTAWRGLERQLIGYDESWRIWVIWLRFRLFGIVADDIPHQAWPEIERFMAIQPEAFWSGSELEINAAFGRKVIEVTEKIIDDEVSKAQSAFGLTFLINEDAKIDLEQPKPSENGDIILSVSREVSNNALQLLELCKGNSAAHLRERVSQYLEILASGVWENDMLLVMRGDVLRSELSFQNSREEDSDIPPISQATHRALEQTVSLHNMLVNAHPELARIDRMLKGPDVDVTPVRHGELRKIIANAEERAIISKQAVEAMNMVSDEFQNSSSPYQDVRSAYSIGNFFRVPIKFIWENRKKLASGLGLSGALYGFGHWALANESYIISLFSKSSTMKLAVHKIFEMLHTLPLK